MRRVVRAVGDLVDLWVTLNEPMVPIIAGYIAAYHPPCRRAPLAAARVFEQLLRAHALAYRIVHEAAPRAPGGTPTLVGFASAYQLVEAYHETGFWRLLETPLARILAQGSFGAWDRSLLTGRVSLPYGFGRRIPGLAGSTDFTGVNYYMRISARLAALASLGSGLRSLSAPRFGGARFALALGPGTLSNVKSTGYACPPGIEQTEMGWQIYPPGLFAVLDQVHRSFRKPIWITENGCCDSGDDVRRRYLLSHLAQVQRAIQSGCDVRGYLHWTLTDNFEWREGFEKKFGMVAVDPNDAALRRTPKQSAFLLRDIARGNALTQEIVDAHGPGALDAWPLAPGSQGREASAQ